MTNDQPEPDTGDMPSAKRLREAKKAHPIQRLHLITWMKKLADKFDNIHSRDLRGVTYLDDETIKELEEEGYCVAVEEDKTIWMISWSKGATE